jgi:4-hydroxy-3-methylbut-2-enyl diphosphate reductase
VRSIAADVDVVLVVGSANSSNATRLVEVARRAGVRAERIDDASDIDLAWLEGARSVGLTAGASTPESLVTDAIAALAGLGTVTVTEQAVQTETITFSLPPEVR